MNKDNIKHIILTIVFALLYYYIVLPPLNVTSINFWVSIIIILFFYVTISGSNNLFKMGTFDEKGNFKKNQDFKFNNTFLKVLGVIGIIGLGIAVVNFVLSPVFNADAFAKRINVIEENNFQEDVEPVSFDKLAIVDKDSSQRLGDRVMGQMPELVSQFYVSDLYTQVNHQGNIERVTPLEYADIFKYFTNRKDGITGYIKVDSVTGESSLTKLEKGMKYAPSALFGEDLNRKLRFSYPFDIFGKITFEVDEEDNPFWIVPVIKYVGITQRAEVNGVIIFNPVDGTSVKYNVNDVPTWVDHVYDAELIIDQVNNWGSYKNGFINSIIGQKGVVATTWGYNYLVMNDDVYMYTGITSAATDESNVGFILSNLRTKETRYYAVPGAEEYSAMDSAQGQVQQMDYVATFPLLINLNNKPTYFISLKDYAGLVKMYAFVDVVDYQKVKATEASQGLEAAAKNYLGNTIDATKEKVEAQITIRTITNVVDNNKTIFYLTDTNNNKYQVSYDVNKNLLPFLTNGSKINIIYTDGEIKQIIEVE